MDKESTDLRYEELHPARVDPQLLHLKPKSFSQKAVFLISIFLPAFIPIFYIMDGQKWIDLIVNWVFFFIFGMLLIDGLRRLEIFPKQEVRVNLLIGAHTTAFLILLSRLIYWMAVWNTRSSPVLGRLFA